MILVDFESGFKRQATSVFRQSARRIFERMTLPASLCCGLHQVSHTKVQQRRWSRPLTLRGTFPANAKGWEKSVGRVRLFTDISHTSLLNHVLDLFSGPMPLTTEDAT